MIDALNWMKELKSKLQAAFGGRLCFLGLQGSRRRGEASETSDIDVVTVLDSLSPEDLRLYRGVLDTMPHRELACGFICGSKELRAWPRHELRGLLEDTQPIYGELSSLLPEPNAEDAADYLRISAGNLYHEVCHRYLYGGSPAQQAEKLRGAYKTAVFMLQHLTLLRTGSYPADRAALLPLVSGDEKEILTRCMNWDALAESRRQQPEDWLFLLLRWSSAVLEKVSPDGAPCPDRHPLLKQKLDALNLPPLLPEDFQPKDWAERRQQLVITLCKEVYGFPPPPPAALKAETLSEEAFCAGKATLQKLRLTASLPSGGDFSFPVTAVLPKGEGPFPFFVMINFRPDVPDKCLPSEEICDRGYAVLSFYYEDIAPDRDDGFTEGLPALLPPEECPGKLTLWAWAASRVLDWALTQPQLDPQKAAVIGHSRLGKTALLCGALDTRFAAACSNDSGCSGAAITREKRGERVEVISRVFPFWFCKSYRQYADREQEMPFDQHFLLAAMAPRLLLVGSAEEDIWADPDAEYLSCRAASEAWELLGLPGLIAPDRLPQAGDAFRRGSIGYHLRSGAHYFSREDWNRYMDFLDEKWK